MKFRQKSTTIQTSALRHGWHPGYLLRVQEEPKPEFMKLSPQDTAYAWYCALWQGPGDVASGQPEEHIAYTSPTFNSGGGTTKDGKPMSPSTAYRWVSDILGRPLGADEQPELCEQGPMPVRVKVERTDGKDFIRIRDFEPWDEAPSTPPASIQALMGQPPVPHLVQDAAPADIPF